MNIRRWPKESSVDNRAGQMLRCSSEEALQIIASLSRQLVDRDGNAGRAEFVVGGGCGPDEYFSIAVDFREKPKPEVSLREAAVDLANHLTTRAFAFSAIGYTSRSIVVQVASPSDLPDTHMGHPVMFFTRGEEMPPITKV